MHVGKYKKLLKEPIFLNFGSSTT